MEAYDPAWFLKKGTTTTTTLQPLTPATDTSEDDIDPKLDRNNTPFQDIARIAGLIERTGIPTSWEQAFPCPCINPETNQPRSDCPICHGRGYAYTKQVMLNVAYQSNEKQPFSGYYGEIDTGTTLATPQITENGIENGISIWDRLTIPGLTLGEKYIFNVSQTRIDRGIFIPYHVVSFDRVITMDKSNNLYQLAEGDDFTYDSQSSMMKVDKKYLGQNITMNMTTWLRYYVVDSLKETRYAQVKKSQDKQLFMGEGNERLSKYFHEHQDKLDPGIDFFRMPKKLLLRREEVYLGAMDFTTTGDKPTNSKYIDNKAVSDNIMDMFGRVKRDNHE